MNHPSLSDEEPSPAVNNLGFEAGKDTPDPEASPAKYSEEIHWRSADTWDSSAVSSAEQLQEGASDELVLSEPKTRPSVDAHVKIKKNEGTAVGYLQQIVRSMVDGHELPEHYVKDCVHKFAPPKNIGDAKNTLDANNAVVVVAGPDTGRHETAVYLLNSRQEVTLREFRREPGDPLEINDLDMKTGSAWLLDLRNESKLQHYFGRSLISMRQKLKARNSYLVVVISPSLWRQSGDGAQSVEYTPHPAPAVEIVKSRLSALDQPIESEPYTDDARITQSLEGASPSEAVRWAEAIEKAEILEVTSLPKFVNVLQDSTEAPKKDVDLTAQRIQNMRTEAAISIYSNWRDELFNIHLKQKDSRVRNFLLTSAVLEGCPSGEVFEAASKLAVTLGEDHPAVEGQNGPGIIELVHHIGAELRDDKYVVFSKPNYASAILDYFWADREHLQRRLITWMFAQARQLQGTSGFLADRIAESVLRWTTEHYNLELLRQLVKDFASEERFRELLVDLITVVALRDDPLGKNLRDQLLTWARDQQPAINTIVAEVCGGELARLRPTVALFRLGALTEHSNDEVVDRVKESIRSMWQRPEVRGRIINQVASWCTHSDIERRKAGTRVFLALAEIQQRETGYPELITISQSSYSEWVDTLARGWYGILTTRPPMGAQILESWVTAAKHSSEVLEHLKRILATAVVGFSESDTDERRHSFFARVLYSSGSIPTSNQEESNTNNIKEEIFTYVTSTLEQLGRRPGHVENAGIMPRPHQDDA